MNLSDLTSVDFLSHLNELDIKLKLEEGRLKCNAPKGALTPALVAELRHRKEELISYFQHGDLQEASEPPIQPVSREHPLPLSFAQQRLWFLNELEGPNATYNMPGGIHLLGELNVLALERTLNEIVRRHEVLRTTFEMHNSEPKQVIHAPKMSNLPIVDLQHLPKAEQEAEVERLVDQEAQAPFNLATGPLLRINLLRLAANEHILLVTMHHIVSDGWSIGIFIEEMATLYRALVRGTQEVPRTLNGQDAQDTQVRGTLEVPCTLNGQHQQEQVRGTSEVPCTLNGQHQQEQVRGTSEVPRTLNGQYQQEQVRGTSEVPRTLSGLLPDLPIQYADFAHWQREWLQGEVLKRQLDFWREQLAGAPPLLELPTDRARPAVQTFRGGRESFTLNEELTKQLNTLTIQAGGTLFMTLISAFALLLARYSGQSNVVIGTPIANRNRQEIEGLIGFFVNTLALHVDMSENPTFVELLAQVRQRALGAFAHQDLPFEKLVEELQPERNLAHAPIFQVMFVYQNVPGEDLELPGLTLSSLSGDTITAKFDMNLSIGEEEGELGGSWEYNSDLFDASTIRRMITHFETLLAAIVENPEQRVNQLPLLTAQERHQLLVEWNQTDAELPKEQCFHQLFESQVTQTPDAIAAIFEGKSLTYQQLNARANQWANVLIKQGVQADSIVGLLAFRGLDFLTAILAVFKAGGAYLPLDPFHPAKRIRQVLEQSQTPLVLAAREFEAVLSPPLTPPNNRGGTNEESASETSPPLAPPNNRGGMDEAPETTEVVTTNTPQILFIEELREQAKGESEENLPVRCTREDLAYVIFTSGSTGTPKGAMVEQKGMLNHLYAKVWDLKLTNADTVAQNASQCFDISVWQFLSALLVGGKVVIFNEEAARDPVQLLQLVAKERVTILEVVPSLMRMMLDVPPTVRPDLSHLRWLIPTGEALPPTLCREWFAAYPTIPMINAYGPTECSDDVTHYPIYQAPGEEVINMPIGRPIANMRMYILDADLQPVPIGVEGELYVGGIGVGRGYLNDTKRTADAFIVSSQKIGVNVTRAKPPRALRECEASPWETSEVLETSEVFPDVIVIGGTEERRLYKTGDKARYLSDGNIEFRGRVDFQVKIRGFRIELGEIQVALNEHEAVREAVVVAREDKTGNKRLVAYWVPVSQGEEMSPSTLRQAQGGAGSGDGTSSGTVEGHATSITELRRYLFDRLPDYMVPSAFVQLDAMPLTPNGKINRRALPEPDMSQNLSANEFVAPQTATQKQLAPIWATLLTVEASELGINNNFFELGGHSLLATQLISRVRETFKVELPLRTLFERPTIADFADAIEKEQAKQKPMQAQATIKRVSRRRYRAKGMRLA